MCDRYFGELRCRRIPMSIKSAEGSAAALRSRIEDIDRRLLTILLAEPSLKSKQLKHVANLEHLRTAAWRMLIAAETNETNE